MINLLLEIITGGLDRLLVKLRIPVLLVQEDVALPATDAVDTAVKSATTVFTIVMIAIGVLVVGFIGLKIWGELQKQDMTGAGGEDDLTKARKLEKKGDYVLAASYYEKATDYQKAIELYTLGKDFSRAGSMYEIMQQPAKAMAMYKKSGDANKIAGMYMKTGNYIEAAKIFKSKGDTLRAAQAFEKMGNHAAAAREYAEASKFIKAAKLYKEAGLFKEAGNAFYKTFEGQEVRQENLSQYFTLAAFMVMGEDLDGAKYIYKKIYAVDPEYKDVARKLRLIEGGPEEEEEKPPEAPSTPAEAAAPVEAAAPAPEPEPAEKVMEQMDIDDLFSQVSQEQQEKEQEESSAGQNESSLRGMIKSGHLDPAYSLRLWMQIMKQLDEHHSSGKFFGCITPDSIYIDMENNIRLEKPTKCPDVYTPPELKHGDPADERSDVYAMGVILYEMITGTTESIGTKYPIDYVKDLPEWLDKLVMRCLEDAPSARYRGVDEVSGIVMMKAAEW